MPARIYRPAKTAMQSGRGNIKRWVLEYEPAEQKKHDPLMGWTGSGDTNRQIRMKFESRESCVAYAERHGLEFEVQEPLERRLNIKSYSDNFS